MGVKPVLRKWRRTASLAVLPLILMLIAVPAQGQDDGRDAAEHHNTATPIKHVIIIIGENRTFDNIYATYVPKHGSVWNLLSKGIVHADGSPGPHADLARQFQLNTINPLSFFIDTSKLINPGKTAYAPFLPTPEAGGAPPQAVTRAQFLKDPADSAPPFDANTFSASQLHTISPALEIPDLHILTTGSNRSQELHSRSHAAAYGLLRAGQPRGQFRQAAQHNVPDHRRQAAV